MAGTLYGLDINEDLITMDMKTAGSKTTGCTGGSLGRICGIGARTFRYGFDKQAIFDQSAKWRNHFDRFYRDRAGLGAWANSLTGDGTYLDYTEEMAG